MRYAASGGAGEDPFRVALSDPTEVNLLDRQRGEAGARLWAALGGFVVAAPCELLLACLEFARALFVSVYLGRLGRLDARRGRLRAEPLEECGGYAGGAAVFGVERAALLLAAALKKLLVGRAGRALGEPFVMKLFGARKAGGGCRERYALAVGSRVAGGRPVAGCFREPKTAVRLFCVLGRSESIPGVWTLRWCVHRKVRPSGTGSPHEEASLESPGLYASPHARDALSVFFREGFGIRHHWSISRRTTGRPGCSDVSRGEEAKVPAA